MGAGRNRPCHNNSDWGQLKLNDNVVVFYHTCQLPGWETMFDEQIELLRSTKLLEEARVFIHINGVEIPSLRHDNVEYVFNPRPHKEETDTMCAIRDYAASHDNAKILYFHMKGIKSQVSPAWPADPINGTEYVTNWRRMMENYVVKDWKLCVNLLKVYDSVGCNYAYAPRPHWSGGMWWATSEYVRTLDNTLLETESRWDREFWIGSGDIYPLNRSEPFSSLTGTPPLWAELHRSNTDHYNVNYPPELWSPIPLELRDFANE